MKRRRPAQTNNRTLISLNRQTKPDKLLRFVLPETNTKANPKISNLPISLTPFIGRQAEVEAVSELISNPDIRLVTLYGTAGTGKTRLSLAVAEKMKAEFRDGVFFVNLAPISKPELGLAAIAQRLGLQDHSLLPLLQKLQNYLRRRELLLVLDNFEQIVGLGSAISELLLAAPQLKIVVTSRVILQLYGEQVYAVPTLNLPVVDETSSLEVLSQNEAVRLFMQCAGMVNSDFKLTKANVNAIAMLCTYLEGLPLAIELAATRCNIFSPQTLLDRLVAVGNNRFQLLNNGFANSPVRQQTLANAIEWSYDLLNEPEKQLFSRLSLFVGSCSLEAAEAVGTDSASTLELVTSLLNKSLLRRVAAMPGEELRFTMLETIRDYASEKLVESGELELIKKAYLGYFTKMVETGVNHLNKPEQLIWLKRLEADHPNILNTVDYLIEKKEAEGTFRLGGSMWQVWWRWGYLNQGRQWLSRILELNPIEVEDTLQAKLLDGIAYLAMYQNDYRTAEIYFEQSIKIWRANGVSKNLVHAISGLAGAYRILGNYEQALQMNYETLELYRLLGEAIDEAHSLCNIGWQLMERGNYEPALPLLEESLAIHSRANYSYGVARTKIYLGDILWRRNNSAKAIQLLEESILTLRQLNHRLRLPAALYRLGLIYLCEGQLDLAEKMLEESVEIAEEIDNKVDLAYAYSSLGLLRILQENLAEAENLFRQVFKLRPEIGNKLEGVVWSLEGLTVITLKQARYTEAEQLREEAQSLREAIVAPLLPHTVKFIMPNLSGFEAGATIASGKADRSKPRLQAINETVTVQNRTYPATALVEPATSFDLIVVTDLTEREGEVLKLLAGGHSNNQIAKILVISPSTVNNHLTSIYSKLAVNSRTAAIRYALDHNLL